MKRHAFRLILVSSVLAWHAAQGSCAFMAESAWALTLSMPPADAKVSAGQALPVAVEVGREVSLRRLRYYWYRIDEEPLASRQAIPAPFTPSPEGSPLVGTVTVPSDALGQMRLLAVGEVMSGRMESHEEFDEVLVIVGTAAELQSIEFAVEKPWRMTQVGKRIMVPAVGQFSDGVSRPLIGPRAGSHFQSTAEQVVSVDANGVLQVVGAGKATVTVENRGTTGTVDVIVETNGEPNRPPIADVVKELHVRSGDLVLLDGMKSRDPDGDPLHFEWKQILGHRVILSNVNEAKATFVAPKVSEQKQYQFSLVVTDMAGPDTMKGADSAPAIVTVWIAP
jgi:K319-like protein